MVGDYRRAMPTSERAERPGAAGAAAAPAPTPPVYTRPPGKVRDEAVRPPLPGLVVDTLFFAVATAAAAWPALRLLDETWHRSWWHLLLLVPFWAMVAYLVLPRLQTLLTAVYVPGYFIARTRTSDGLLGDPVNLAVDGTALQIHGAMTACGWVLADDVTVRSSWGIVVSSVLRRSYPAAPVSPLRLFGRMQCLAYQLEVEGNAAQRHHVRFWRCPDGWLLPGGHRVQWLGAGTYDRAVGMSLFTLQVTHKIDADIDVERDYIVDSIRFHVSAARVRVLENFSTGYLSRNGGGDEIRTDGDLPVVDLRAVPVPAASAADLPRPAALTAACAMVAASVVVLAVRAAFDLAGADMDEFAGLGPDEVGTGILVIALVLGAVYGAMAVLALLTYLGYGRPRVWLLAVTVAAIVSAESGRLAVDAEQGTVLGGYVGLASNVLVLLLLTGDAARTWSRRTAGERRARRARGGGAA